MPAKNIENQIEEVILEEITRLGYDLYDVEYVKEGRDFYLRIYIDSKDGIGIDDCEKVNNVIDPILDEKDLIKEQYFLEVSSVGLERALRKEKHFKGAIGEKIEVKLYKKVDNKKSHIGILEKYENDKLYLSEDEKEVELNKNDIASAKVIYEWN